MILWREDVRERLERMRTSLEAPWWRSDLLRDWGTVIAFLLMAAAIIWAILALPLGIF